jgi:hypothetical protein
MGATYFCRCQFLTKWFAPRGKVAPRGVNGPHGWTLSPRGNVHPFVHPRGWTLYSLEVWRGEQIISPPGDNFTPRGQSSHLGYNFDPGGQSLPLGVNLRMGLRPLQYKSSKKTWLRCWSESILSNDAVYLRRMGLFFWLDNKLSSLAQKLSCDSNGQ